MGEANLIDGNLHVTKDEENDEAWVNTNGTFWRGSLSQLREFLQLDALVSTEDGENGGQRDTSCD